MPFRFHCCSSCHVVVIVFDASAAGDVIVGVNGVSCKGMTAQQVLMMMMMMMMIMMMMILKLLRARTRDAP